MPKLAAELADINSQRLAQVGPSGIRAFDVKVSAIPGIIKLTIGEPDLNVPEHVKQAAIRSIEENDSHYAPQMGKPRLRQAISQYLKRTRQVDYDPETEVIVTCGATETINVALRGILNEGDKVVIPTPTFALYFPVVTLAGATPIQMDTSKDNFLLTPEHLEKVLAEEGDRVKALILNYPSNPTGVQYPKELIQKLAQVAKKHHLYVITDEIYSDLCYGVEHYSMATALPEQTIFISGLSKSHAMTGYRLGYLAGPAEIMKKLGKLHALMVTSITDNVQAAAIEAFEHGQNDPVEAAKIYQARRDYILAQLAEAGLKTVYPQGAFYIFAQIPASYHGDDVAFANDLAYQAKVGVTPGSAFGKGGEGHVRLSYAASMDDIKEAMARIKQFL